ncbi:hypothetical protein AB6A40_000627 [Gnathostoma spinigerum]|uniref:Uncharacterized protein n=1 Tax=Gnathostoma spinigerum TaxID=75299 RepID=A0ABD6EAY5_9BILA
MLPAADFILILIYGALLHGVRTSTGTGYMKFSNDEHDISEPDQQIPVMVTAFSVLFDVPITAHKCDQERIFFSAQANINFTALMLLHPTVDCIRRGMSLIIQVRNELDFLLISLMLNNVSVSVC